MMASGVFAGVPISAVVDPEDENAVYVNNYGGGNFKSSDGAKTWSDASKGYTGANVRHVAVHPENGAHVYAVGRIGPFMSINGGSDWHGISYGSVRGAEWFCLSINPSNPDELILSILLPFYFSSAF